MPNTRVGRRLLLLCVVLLCAATVVLSGFSKPVIGCEDKDHDGTCVPADCDDNDHSRSMQDLDHDGSTSCAGDCEDWNPDVNYCEGFYDSYIAPDYTLDPGGGLVCTVKFYNVTTYKCTTTPNPDPTQPPITTCGFVNDYRTEVERTCSY